MKTSVLFSFATFSLFFVKPVTAQETTDTIATNIIDNADADHIDLTVLDFLPAALEEITTAYDNSTQATKRSTSSLTSRQATSLIDVHTHVVPSWYKALVPVTGGNPTPDWSLSSQLSFMTSQGTGHAVLSFSAPGPNVFKGNKVLTVALSRLMNEQSAAYVRAFPDKFDFYAVVPLPYTSEAITEANYALDTLGAAGIILTSNVEGMYLGNPQFKQFFNAINNRGGRQIMFVHPSTPYLRCDGNLVEANPTTYPTGNIEFYFETARTIADLTLTQTIHNYTNIHYVIPHAGGAFPSAVDRLLKSFPAIYASSLQIYSSRFWWDSAGPTYFHQISGLLGYNIPKSQLLFGTDFPYAPIFTQTGSLAAIQNSPLLTAAEKLALFTTNAKNLFGSKLHFL